VAIALLVRSTDTELYVRITHAWWLSVYGVARHEVVECTLVTVGRRRAVSFWATVAPPTTHFMDKMIDVYVYGHPISYCYRFRTCVKIHVSGVSMAHLDVKV
jgi:hypothetical protein